MRILGSYSDSKILQVEKTPALGDPVPFNGKFIVPIPEGAKVQVGSTSYILPVDGGDVSSLAMAGLLAQYPMYGNIVFNPLLTAADVADLDLTASGPTGYATRAQTGRGAGPAATGMAPCMTVVLPQNNLVAPAKPGCLVTDTIDISAQTGGAGANEFMVWWQVYGYGTSHDIRSSFGVWSGTNSPAIKSVTEVDQEPANFEVYLSIDDGITWTQVGRLQPVGFCVLGTALRLAVVNKGAVRQYLAAYAILF